MVYKVQSNQISSPNTEELCEGSHFLQTVADFCTWLVEPVHRKLSCHCCSARNTSDTSFLSTEILCLRQVPNSYISYSSCSALLSLLLFRMNKS